MAQLKTKHLSSLVGCKNNPNSWVEQKQVDIWAHDDVEKVKVAKYNNLNYLILWNYEDIDSFFH